MTDTEICNMALSYLGKGVISSMDESTENARAVKLFYDPARCEILREFPWGFAHRRERLALSAQDIPGWDYAYGYPAECLKLNRLMAETYEPYRKPFDIVNIGASTKIIVTDLENAFADYVWNVQDPNLFDDVFITGFSHLLASKIAMRLTGNPQVMQQEYQLYQATINSARLQDAREKMTEPVYDSSYGLARRGRWYG